MLALLVPSCARPQYYTPGKERVARMGQDGAARRLAELLMTSQGPAAYDVRLGPGVVAFKCQQILVEGTRYDSMGATTTHLACPGASVVELRFLEIASIEVKQPDYFVSLHDADKLRIFMVKFGSRQEALEFVDLLAWFRDAAAQATSAAAPALVVQFTREATAFTPKSNP